MEKISILNNLYLLGSKDKYQVYLHNELIFNGKYVKYYLDIGGQISIPFDTYEMYVIYPKRITNGIFTVAIKNIDGTIGNDTFIDVYLNEYRHCQTGSYSSIGVTDTEIVSFYNKHKIVKNTIQLSEDISSCTNIFFTIMDDVIITFKNKKRYYYHTKCNIIRGHEKSMSRLGKYVSCDIRKVILDKDDNICIRFDTLISSSNHKLYYLRDNKYYIFYDGIEYKLKQKLELHLQYYYIDNDNIVNSKIVQKSPGIKHKRLYYLFSMK